MLRRPWAAAGPGWAIHSNPAPLVWRVPEGVGGIGGPGCGARGRWQGLAGLRDDAPSRRLAARTARGRAAAHGHIKQPGPRTEQPGPTYSEGPEAPQRLGPLACQLLTG